MPQSVFSGKTLTALFLNRLHARSPITRIIDIGPGEGTYARLMRNVLKVPYWTGVEVWYPNIEKFELSKFYDQLVIADGRWIDYSLFGNNNVAIFGDVLEHMTREEASETLYRCLGSCRAALVSLPIGYWPQGQVDGNTFETHIDSWSLEDARNYLPNVTAECYFDYGNGLGLGIFVCARTGDNRRHALECMTESRLIAATHQELQSYPFGILPSSQDAAFVSGFAAMVGPHLV